MARTIAITGLRHQGLMRECIPHGDQACSDPPRGEPYHQEAGGSQPPPGARNVIQGVSDEEGQFIQLADNLGIDGEQPVMADNSSIVDTSNRWNTIACGADNKLRPSGRPKQAVVVSLHDDQTATL